MVDTPEPPAGAADDPVEQPDAPSGPTRAQTGASRRIDRRTLAICFVIALIAAIGAGLLATIVLGGDDSASPTGSSDDMVLTPSDINAKKLLGETVTTTDGNATTLDELRGDGPTLVNFWQSTCAPCIKEMPMLEEAQADNPDTTFVGVNTQETLEEATPLAEQTGITYPWVLDPKGDLAYAAQAVGMPTSLLLDADGTVIATETGEFADREELDAFLAQAD